MRRITRVAVGAAAVVGLSLWMAPVAGAQALHGTSGSWSSWAPGSAPGGSFAEEHVVFVQNDAVTGNRVIAYDQERDGQLAPAGTYPTGGLGGVLNGSAVDHLGSEGSLAADPAFGLLLAVNAGSNTVGVFSVRGDRLTLRQVVSSHGSFPVSIAVHGALIYVLNAMNGGNVSGFQVVGGGLRYLPGSTRPLGLVIPTDTTQFTHTPGQVAFSPDGSQLLVTTKDNASGNDVDVFAVHGDGRLSDAPVENAEPGTIPFAVSFDRSGHLLLAEAAPSAVVSFDLQPDGTISQIDSLASGQPGLCWITAAGPYFFTGNTASNSTSGYQSAPDGQLTLLGATATDPGTVDGAATPDGRFLYVQTGGTGILDQFQVHPGGSLTEVGAVTVPDAVGGEGIVAW